MSDLFDRLCSFENLDGAYRAARRGKRSRPDVAAFEYDSEANLFGLQEELRSQSYQPGLYHSFHVHEPKRRLISAAPFRDRVVHHALVRVVEPSFERRFIADSYANRVGKGTHRALGRCTSFARRFRYVLPIDVVGFFPAIDHEVLRRQLARVLTDQEVLWLCDVVLTSGVGVLSEEYSMVYFPGDDLFAINRERGLPIGNLTSQFWANCYLNGLDQYIKRRLRASGYLRYVDDLLLFADDKKTLWMWREKIVRYLEGLRLTVHEKSAQPRPVGNGIPFLGFHVFPTHRRLKRRKLVWTRRRLKQQRARYLNGEIPLEDLFASIRGWIAHAEHGDTWGLRRAVFRDLAVGPRRGSC